MNELQYSIVVLHSCEVLFKFCFYFFLLILKTARLQSNNVFRYVHVISVLVRILTDIFNTY